MSTRAPSAPAAPVVAGRVTLLPGSCEARLDGAAVDLTFNEFALLLLLARRANQVLRYAEAEEALWQGHDARLRNRARVLVCRLRAKLRPAHPLRIDVVRKVGYRLVVPAP